MNTVCSDDEVPFVRRSVSSEYSDTIWLMFDSKNTLVCENALHVLRFLNRIWIAA